MVYYNYTYYINTIYYKVYCTYYILYGQNKSVPFTLQMVNVNVYNFKVSVLKR